VRTILTEKNGHTKLRQIRLDGTIAFQALVADDLDVDTAIGDGLWSEPMTEHSLLSTCG